MLCFCIGSILAMTFQGCVALPLCPMIQWKTGKPKMMIFRTVCRLHIVYTLCPKNIPDIINCTTTTTIDSVDVQSTDVVRDLGVLLDSELTLKQHVNRITTTCFYHLRRLRQIKRHVDVKVMKQLISAFIFSRLDYCNVILIGLPLSTIAPLQRVQNVYLWGFRGVTMCVLLWKKVQAGSDDVHDPHSTVPRLSQQFCTGVQ